MLALVGKLFLLLILCYLFVFMLTTDGPAAPAYRPPFLLWILDTINLFIHEAGHFFLRPFGMFIYILGGSLVQCAIPLALLIVTWRQNHQNVAWSGFWLGENLVNVSYYITDAPFRKLKLLAGGLIHDWGYLLAGNTELGLPIGAFVYWVGMITCTVSIIAGVIFAVQSYRAETNTESTPNPESSKKFL